MAEQQEYIDAYYKLKNDYAEKNGSIAATLSSSLPAEKRTAYKCVSCRKPGGTIFEESAESLHAVCGADPKCDLDVTIKKNGPVIQMPQLLQSLKEKLEDEKTKLIELKIQHALGSISDEAVLQQFESGRNLLQRLSSAIASVDQKMLSVTDSPEKQATINRLKAEIYTLTQEYKTSLSEFRGTGREAFLIDALEQQTNVIEPLVTELRETLYAKSIVEYKVEMDEYTLVQEPFTLRDMEVTLSPEFKQLLSQNPSIEFKTSSAEITVDNSIEKTTPVVGEGGFL